MAVKNDNLDGIDYNDGDQLPAADLNDTTDETYFLAYTSPVPFFMATDIAATLDKKDDIENTWNFDDGNVFYDAFITENKVDTGSTGSSFSNMLWTGTAGPSPYAYRYRLLPPDYDDFEDDVIDTDKWNGWVGETNGYIHIDQSSGAGACSYARNKESLDDGEVIFFESFITNAASGQGIGVSASGVAQTNTTAIYSSFVLNLRKYFALTRNGSECSLFDLTAGTELVSNLDCSTTGLAGSDFFVFWYVCDAAASTKEHRLYNSWKGSIANLTGSFFTNDFTTNDVITYAFPYVKAIINSNSAVGVSLRADNTQSYEAGTNKSRIDFSNTGSTVGLKVVLTTGAGATGQNGLDDMPYIDYHSVYAGS